MRRLEDQGVPQEFHLRAFQFCLISIELKGFSGLITPSGDSPYFSLRPGDFVLFGIILDHFRMYSRREIGKSLD